MSTAERARMRIPLQLIVVDIVGTAITGLGIYALSSDVPPSFAPALGDPAKAGLLVALGVALMGYAVFEIVRLAAKAACGR
ncbi:MAG: hypothetical protein AMJ64_13860 [Betaproteobacteria bacterium SG8_39]|jgi:hypothetical protein|nr:MAG: hypothetical protein AMJ64_13860 [Betaproteobacteria bacterium SG8_39]